MDRHQPRVHRGTGARPKVCPRTNSAESTIPFSFSHLPYPSAAIMGDDREAWRTSIERGKTLVYLREELNPGMKLCLVVAALQVGANNGMSFGVTTCPPPRQRRFGCHIQDFCKPGAECGGNSIWMKVFNINKVGDFVTFEKITTGAPDLVSITVNHRQPVVMKDPTGIFASSPLHPFFMMTGTVSKIRLTTPPRPSLFPPVARTTRPNIPTMDSTERSRTVSSPSLPVTQVQPQVPSYLRRSVPPRTHHSQKLVTETHIPSDSWLFQNNITVNETVIGRDGKDVKNYIFNRNPFLKEQIITFAVREVESIYPGTITFGVTTEDPATIRLDTLPINSNELQIERFNKTWFVYSDIVPSVTVNQQLSIKRSATKFSVKYGIKNIQTLFYVEPTKTVYPFFNLNGSIKSIELVGNDVAIFNEALKRLESSLSRTTLDDDRVGKCVICLEESANHMLVPCNHVALCGSCSDNLKVACPICPICRASFTKVTKVFLA